MQLNNKNLHDWTLEDIGVLINDPQWRESSTIDYKCDFRASDEGFKKDVCAFANAQGGYLFMGIDEDDGLATEIVGIDDVGIDKFNLGISNALASSVEPFRPSYETHLISLGEDTCVLVVHVFEGYDKPYRVRNEGRFWVRGNAGNEGMSYMAIEDAFLRTSAQEDKLQALIDNRIGYLCQADNPAYILYGHAPFLAVHAVPLSSASGHEKRYQLKAPLDTPQTIFKLTNDTPKLAFETSSQKINMDGLIKYRLPGDASSGFNAHIQLFWNGIVEMATNRLFRNGRPFAPGLMLDIVPDILKTVVGYFDTIGMLEPFFTVLSIENAMNQPYILSRSAEASFDRSRLRTYPVRVDDRSGTAVSKAVNELLDEFGYLIGENAFSGRLNSSQA